MPRPARTSGRRRTTTSSSPAATTRRTTSSRESRRRVERCGCAASDRHRLAPDPAPARADRGRQPRRQQRPGKRQRALRGHAHRVDQPFRPAEALRSAATFAPAGRREDRLHRDRHAVDPLGGRTVKLAASARAPGQRTGARPRAAAHPRPHVRGHRLSHVGLRRHGGIRGPVAPRPPRSGRDAGTRAERGRVRGVDLRPGGSTRELAAEVDAAPRRGEPAPPGDRQHRPRAARARDRAGRARRRALRRGARPPARRRERRGRARGGIRPSRSPSRRSPPRSRSSRARRRATGAVRCAATRSRRPARGRRRRSGRPAGRDHPRGHARRSARGPARELAP